MPACVVATFRQALRSRGEAGVRPRPQSPSPTPECVPRCDEVRKETQPYGMAFTIAALPGGTCDFNGERCSFRAVRERICDDGERVHCSLSTYTCRCES